jgi:hypothetical protein
MFSAANQPAVSNSLLNEVATSGVFPDPALFVYGVLGALMIGSLLIAYVIFGRTAGRERTSSEVFCVGVRGVRHGRMR